MHGRDHFGKLLLTMSGGKLDRKLLLGISIYFTVFFLQVLGLWARNFESCVHKDDQEFC